MEKQIMHIFDKVLKKGLTLSQIATINFLNGCFDEDFPLDSTITYNWTEHIDDELKKTIADGIITVNGEKAYHVEGQIAKDDEMQFRMFDYGYKHALTAMDGCEVLHFPEPVIIYLYKYGKTPDVQKILLDFGTQGTFEYKVNTFKLLEHNLEEVNRRKMLVLLPFMILKFRDAFEKERTEENMNALQNYILNDILGVIKENVEAGNLTVADAERLRNLIAILYRYLYAGYEECQKEGINDMVEEGLVLEMDIIEYEHKKELEKKEEQVTKEVTKEVQGSLIRNAYETLQDTKQVALLLKLSEGEVRAAIQIGEEKK
ncbi:MAG: hypothetical protein PHS82_10040 [Lachnospiraceae bacterium]|nr:hypothetical protein [Lachnospiraceae bacterium]